MRADNSDKYNRPDLRWVSAIARIVFILAIIAIAYASVLPSGSSASIPHLDKLFHALAYGGLTIILAIAFTRLHIFGLFLVPVMYGAGLEIIQGVFTQSRTASWADALANASGVALILCLWCLWIHTKHNSVSS